MTKNDLIKNQYSKELKNMKLESNDKVTIIDDHITESKVIFHQYAVVNNNTQKPSIAVSGNRSNMFLPLELDEKKKTYNLDEYIKGINQLVKTLNSHLKNPNKNTPKNNNKNKDSKYCCECGGKIPSNVKYCSHCGGKQ